MKEVKPHTDLVGEVDKLEPLFARLNLTVIFCHNDVWAANFIHDSIRGIVSYDLLLLKVGIVWILTML